MSAAPFVEATKISERGFAALRNDTIKEESQKNIDYTSLVNELRTNFHSRKSYSYEYRVNQLNNLRRGMFECEKLILDAGKKDLRKHPIEALQGEFAIVVGEIDYALKHLNEWMKPISAPTPITLQPGKSMIHKQPKGVTLIIAPWNFPINLALGPLVSAIAAGCAAVVKPSEMTPESEKVVELIIKQYLDPDLYRCVRGAVAETTALLKQTWNHIFYTGNGAVGRAVARAAAESLCSCTLELGGKSPVYVSEDANVRVAARRIIGTKVFNNGQVCVAPDYVTVHASVRDQLIEEMKKHYDQLLGPDPQKSPSLSRIVNTRHFDRVANLIKDDHGGKIVVGGLEKADRNDRFIPLTLILDPKLSSPLMHEEIFGPILPIVTVPNMEEALKIINSKDSSLASYVYTESNEIADKFIQHSNSGGTSVNDCIFHMATPDMPFGGHSGGGSGVGSYHGLAGFQDFTHQRSTFTHSTFMDPNNRYMPYKEEDMKLLKMLLLGVDLPPLVVTGMKVAAAGAVFALVKSKL